jgi:signal transduction histidine kinase
VLCRFEDIEKLPLPLAMIGVIADLIMHARDMMPGGGTIFVGLRRAGEGEGPFVQPMAGAYAMLCVSDSGAGMPPDVLARAFSRTNRRRRESEQFARLARAKTFADRVHGAISLASAVNDGTTVKIWIPLRAEAACGSCGPEGSAKRQLVAQG